MRLLPAIISAVLLGAHFFRAGLVPLAIMTVLFPAILLVKRPWAARLLQLVLLLGTLEWLRTLLIIVAERREAGEAWTRLAVILGGVAVFSAIAALCLGVFVVHPSVSPPPQRKNRLP